MKFFSSLSDWKTRWQPHACDNVTATRIEFLKTYKSQIKSAQHVVTRHVYSFRSSQLTRRAFYLIPPCVWRRSVTTLPAQNTDSHLCFLSLTSFVRRNRDWYKYGIWHIIMVALMMFRWLAHYLLRFSTEHSKDLWQTFCFKILLELFTKCSPNCQCGIIQSQTEGKTTPVSDLRSSLITVNNELMTDTTGDLYWLTF